MCRRLTAAPALALGSAILLWASFPPLDLWPLAWVAPVPWLLLVRAWPKPKWLGWICYGGGLAFWLAAIQWLRLGDATMYTAWIALSIYLAAYTPAFVALCRQAVHRLKLPLLLAAPAVWVGLEMLRAHFLSGFAWYFLAHTQYRWIALIQISDLVGAYGVSFLIMLVAALLAEMIPARWLAGETASDSDCEPAPHQLGVALPELAKGESDKGCRDLFRFPIRLALLLRAVLVGILLPATLVYGAVRLSQADFRDGPKVALIQGNVPQTVKHDPDEWPKIYRDHKRLTLEAAREHPDLDLIVWPESMFRWRLVQIDPQVTDDQLQKWYPKDDPQDIREASRDIPSLLHELRTQAGSSLLIGLDTIELLPSARRFYTSAALVTGEEPVFPRYDKLHLVPFGEYLPLADTLPWLLAFTPFEQKYGLDAGAAPVIFELGSYRFAAVICYEDTVPHLVRRVVRLQATDYGLQQSAPERQSPESEARSLKPGVDFLVNLTNDGWFHGSSELEQHLITSAFRAVECRTPLLRAVNTGISAIIDGNGRILPDKTARDPKTGRSKQVEAIVVGHVPLDPRRSLYVSWGDWFASLCLACCAALAFSAVWSRMTKR